MRISANLGFLWSDRPLPDAIRCARKAGFDAVECHWPYEESAEAVKRALDETGLPMIALNTPKGPYAGDAGLAAQPGREAEARASIDQAFDYGQHIGVHCVHVMAGNRVGETMEACLTSFAKNLEYACDRARVARMTVLIEPLNPRDNPDYILRNLDMAKDVLACVDRSELAILFDCYHQQITEGDLLRRFWDARSLIAHVQFAGVPDRNEPDCGEIAYNRILPEMIKAGFSGVFGAEYRPSGKTEETLSWIADLR